MATEGMSVLLVSADVCSGTAARSVTVTERDMRRDEGRVDDWDD